MSFPRYPKYKDSGVEWLGDVPEHWGVKRLRFVAKLNPSKSEIGSLDRDASVSFLPMDAIGDDGTLALEKEKAIRDVENGYTYFRDGDVVVAKITPCYENGKGALMRGLTNGIGFGTTELIVARPRPEQIIGTYLHYLFISPDFRGLGESHMYGAGGQKRVPDEFVRSFATAFPPILEQTQIAAFLDHETAKIDELVAEQGRLMDLLKEKLQAVISHAVTKGLNPNAPMKPSGVEWLGDVPAHWEVLPLAALSESIQTGPFGSQLHSADYVDDATPVINPSNIQDGRIFPDWSCTVADEIVDRLRQHKLLPGDIVFGRRGEMGRCAMVSKSEANWLCGTGCLNVRLNCRAMPAYVSIFLRTAHVRELLKLESVGSTMDNLNTNILARVRVPVPPTSEQAAIAAFLDTETTKLNTLTAEAQRAIDLLQERRTALISAAVTGQIDVRALSPGQKVDASGTAI